jgi:membrane protease YdiL (CAAX protease family)
MLTNFSNARKAAGFTVLVLLLALVVALLIRMLGDGVFLIWSLTPTIAALIILLALTREGYSKEGWKSLGLHRFGLRIWWLAFGLTLLISLIASFIVWITPLASFVMPRVGAVVVVLNFMIMVAFTLPFALGEEIGMRGYLLSKLLSLG